MPVRFCTEWFYVWSHPIVASRFGFPAGWEPLLGAKFSDGRVVVALSHFCDVVATGPCGLKAVGFIDPHGANAKVALLHVACESCQNSLEQLCSDADMLGSFKKCGPSAPLGTYRHDEDLQLRQGQEAVNMRVRFHRMPQISRKLVAHSASHFSVEIEGDDHQFEELRSEAATSATASNPTASDPPSAPATSQAQWSGVAWKHQTSNPQSHLTAFSRCIRRCIHTCFIFGYVCTFTREPQHLGNNC